LNRRAAVGAARVRVADVGGEEFEETRDRVIAGGGDQGGGVIGDDNDFVHAALTSSMRL
jgi:ATP-dependent Zn protease